VDDAQKRADRERHSEFEPRLELLPCASVHADLAPATALASPNEHRSATWVEVGFSQVERLADPQPRPPQDDDQRP
jgi:hypothetical protein